MQLKGISYRDINQERWDGDRGGRRNKESAAWTKPLHFTAIRPITQARPSKSAALPVCQPHTKWTLVSVCAHSHKLINKLHWCQAVASLIIFSGLQICVLEKKHKTWGEKKSNKIQCYAPCSHLVALVSQQNLAFESVSGNLKLISACMHIFLHKVWFINIYHTIF